MSAIFGSVPSHRRRAPASNASKKCATRSNATSNWSATVKSRTRDLASKNHHALFGQLGVLLKMVTDGEITHLRPTVLTIEATDRLFRSGQFEAFDVLKKLVVDGGMIVVTGDMSIWNYHSVNDSMKSVKLNVEISMARGYAQRLSDMALSSHADKREMMAELAMNPTAPKPRLAGRPPAWIILGRQPKETRVACGSRRDRAKDLPALRDRPQRQPNRTETEKRGHANLG